jgi:hypothetical protein
MEPKTLRSAVVLDALSWLLIGFFAAPALAQEFDAREFCPFSELSVGDFATFRVTEPGFDATYDSTVVCSIAAGCNRANIVNGVPTSITQDRGGLFPGRLLLRTSDGDGVRIHLVFVPNLFDPAIGFYDRQAIYVPPLKVMEQRVFLGEEDSRSGTVFVTASDGSSAEFPYQRTSRIRPHTEWVTVPFGGPFETIVIERDDGGEASSIDWIASGLCSVRSEFRQDGVLTTSELVDTSRVYTPEPSSPLLQFAALVVLGVLRRRSPRGVRL